MNAASGRRLLVTGAGGRLGRRVVELLLARGSDAVVAATRTPERVEDLRQAGAEVRFADFDQPTSLDRAFAGVDRLLLVSTGSDPTRQLRFARHRAAIESARRCGVGHVVYTSVVAARPSREPSLFDDHWRTEQVLAASSLGWTVLRNNLYADQLFDGLPAALAFGRLTTVAPTAKIGYVLRDECAQAAAAALAADAAGCRVFDVTGAVAVDRQTVASVAGELCGRSVVTVVAAPRLLRRNLLAVGLWEHVVDSMIDIELSVAQGRHAAVSDGFERLTGRPPRSVLDALGEQVPALVAGCAAVEQRSSAPAAATAVAAARRC